MSDQVKNIFSATDGMDDKSLAILLAALEKNNLSGFDYLQFKEAVNGLINLKMEEELAFKSAFTTASTMGLTKDKLIETAGYYRNALQKEETSFSEALQNQLTSKVEAKKEEVKKYRHQIEKHKEQLKKLEEEIAVYLDKIETTEASILDEDKRIASAKEKFEKTHKSILRQMDQDIENIHKFLG